MAALSAALVRGEREAFEHFYAHFFARLYLFLLRLARGREELARDAAQEAMIRTLRHMKPFATEGDLWNWLRRVARTAFLDLVRKDVRWHEANSLPGSEALKIGPAGAATDGEAVDEEIAGGLSVALEAGLARLTAAERQLVEQHYFDGRSHEQIGSEQRISAKAVESRLWRTRKKLRGYLIEEMER